MKIYAALAALLLALTVPAWAADGTYKLVLVPASPQTCTSIVVNGTGTGRLTQVNNGGTAQTAVLSVYDEGTSPTCAAADLNYQVTLGASQVIALSIPYKAGLAYTLSAAAVANIVVVYN